MKLDIRQQLLTTTIIVGASLLASPAFAQTAAPVCNPTGPDCPPVTSDAPTVSTPEAATTAPNPEATPITTNATGGTITRGDEIVVTGSRIPQPNLTSTSPITVVTSQEIKLQGTSRVEDLLNSLPQVFAGQGSTDSNGATGIATVDLRNLGPARTLVLINGRRLVPGDPNTPFADLNFIPSALIKRVDVLTGGASSVYGSDALAGVVNFIMDTNFTGVRIDAQASVYNHNNRAPADVIAAIQAFNFAYPKGMTTDGGQQNITLSIGADLGGERRGHVLAYASYRKINPVTQGDRDFSACGLSGVVGNSDAGLSCGGSSTSVTGRFRRTQVTGTSGGQNIYGAFGRSFTVDPTSGELINARGVGGAFANKYRFNFNPYNFFQRNDERYTFGAFADYEISSGFHPYMEAMYMDDRSRAQIAPSGAFYGTDFFVNCDNPLLTANDATTLCGANAGTSTLQSLYIGRRNVEGGPRFNELRHKDFRIVTGMKGEITKGLTYDFYGQYGNATVIDVGGGDFSRTRLNRSLNVIDNPNIPNTVASPFQPVCASFVNGTDPLCVPWNIFTPGGVTQAAVNYLQAPAVNTGNTGQIVVSGSVVATLGDYGIQSPWADKGIGLAVGAEYRKDTIDTYNDFLTATGDLAGSGTPFGVAEAHGATSVKEVFGELDIPLASNRPFFHELTLQLSGRHSKYNIAGSTDAYKIAGEWSPTPDLRFRGGYNRAVRAPNVLELFTPATVQLFSTAGPETCSGGLALTDPNFAGCLNTFGPNFTTAQATAILIAGIDASPANQSNQRIAGNPNLVPEVSDSYTVGVVLTPRFFRGFTASVDGYDIRIKKQIGTVGANFSLNQCIATGNPFFCNVINRSADGSIFTGPSFIDNPILNLGGVRTRGIDVNASYRTPRLFGDVTIAFDLVGTYLDKYVVETLPGALSVGKYDCAGLFGDSCGTPLPKWRHKLRATVAVNKYISISPAWRHFSGVTNDVDSTNPLLGNGPGTAVGNAVTPRIKQVNYFDLSLQASIQKYSFRIGAQNLLDKSPPITPGYSNNGSNTFAQVYDSLGRYLYASATLDF